MKTFEKFISQIENTAKRSGSEFVLQRYMKTPLTVLHPQEQIIIPTQINNYLQENNLSLDRFINDKLLRERVIKGVN